MAFVRFSDRGGAEALTLLPNLANQRYLIKTIISYDFFFTLNTLITVFLFQESLKDKDKDKESKPKFFLNNAGEVIKRTGKSHRLCFFCFLSEISFCLILKLFFFV